MSRSWYIPTRQQRKRRGVGTLLFMFCLVIFILLLMLVVNYTYLAHSQLRMGEVTDRLAMTVVEALLDDDLLETPATLDQSDDVTATLALVDVYNDKTNAISPANQQLRYTIGSNNPANTDIFVEFGHVDDVTQPVTDGQLTATFNQTPANTPLNTIKIEAARPKNGANPLYLFVRHTFTPQAADVGSASYVTLDSRVIGFQPTATVNTPVVPIGILNTAWPVRPVSVGGTARNDFQGNMRDTGGANAANLVLLNFDENAAGIDTSEIDDQIVFGTSQSQININDGNPNTPSYFLGPVVEGSPIDLTLPADDETPLAAEAIDLVNDLNAVSNSADPRRIFPLYSTYSDVSNEAVIVGFVAAKVIDASYDNVNDRLNLALEPEFVVHFTAVTARQQSDGMNTYNVPENVYIHKLRLSR